MTIDFHTVKKYTRFLSGCTGIRKVHSPFAYEFYKNILKDDRTYYSFPIIERLRSELLQDHSKIKVTELGAGSKVQDNATRKVSNIAKYASKRSKYGRLLFLIVNYFNFRNILELGTSLGLSTAYLASAHSQSQINTLEGCPEVLEIAKKNFSLLRLDNITTIEGNFDNTLEDVLKSMPSLDLAFIDGNHREEPTLHYFEQCLSKVHDESILIFDDIYWSQGMERAWNTIKEHSSVTLTIDTFHLGIVFFRKEIKEKRHFKFKY